MSQTIIQPLFFVIQSPQDCYTVTLIKSLIHSMSTQDLSEQQNGSERDIEEEETLLLDLNYPPPSDNVALESTFTSSSPLELYAKDQRWSNPQATNNVDASDDDVVILSSPRSFLEARKNSRRNAEVIMVNDDDIEMPGHLGIVFDDIEMQGHQEIAQQNKIDTDLKLCLELFNKTETENVQIPTEVPSPETPTFTCPICMDQLTEETSTKCGHIFCKECIEGAMAVSQRCPTCRKKLKKKDIIRVYLPGKK